MSAPLSCHITILVVYTEDTTTTGKDAFSKQVEPLILSTPPHNQLLSIGDINVVCGVDHSGHEDVVGKHGSDHRLNDILTHLLGMCLRGNLAVTGSYFGRKDIHRHPWISSKSRTGKEIDHMLCKDLLSSLLSSQNQDPKHWLWTTSHSHHCGMADS